MLSSDLNKLADSYAQITSEAIDPKGAARMDAAKGKKKETQDQIDKRLMLGKYSPGSKKKKTDKCTSESFYLKRLQAMNPVFAEQYLYIAEILIEEGYENSRLIDNIVEAFPPEMVGYEFISALKAVNPRLHENLQSTEKRQAKAIVMHLSEGPELRKLGTAIKNLFTRKNTSSKTIPDKDRPADMKKGKVYGDASLPTIPDKDRPDDMKKGKVYGDQSATKTSPSGPTPEQMRQKAAEQQAKTRQQMKGDSRMNPSSSSSSSSSTSSPSPAPKAKPALSAKDTASNAEYDRLRNQPGGKKSGSAAAKFGMAASKAKFGNQLKPKTKNPMLEGSVFESLKKARENVGASTCWDGYKAKGTKKKNGKEVPNCVKEEDLSEAPYGVSPNQDPMVPKSHNERMKDARDKSKKQGVFLPPWIGPEPKRVKAKPTTQTAGYEPEGKLLEGIRDKDSEKGTKERKERLEKKRGMKVDDHPQYLETDMKKRQENNEKARKDMDKVKGQKNPHFEDVSHYDVILAFLSENNLIESVEEAEEIMMQLTGAQIVEIIDEFMNN